MTNFTGTKFLNLWLYSAVLVSVLRFLNAAGPGYDLALQFQAAHNLLAGHGLTLYRHAGPELNGPPTLITLTHFPSGYSFLAAALMAIGATVGTVIKLLGSAATTLGWWGWAKLAHPFFFHGLQRNQAWKWAAFAIAITTPLLFTPAWGGTDIFLWAVVPWVLMFTVRASDEAVSGSRWFDALAGALCGFCILMRYASFFLAVYAAFLILWQSRIRLRVVIQRWTQFGVGFMPALALQVYINYFLSNVPATPGGVSLKNTGVDVLVQRLWDGLPLLSMANFSWLFWFPVRGQNLFFNQVAGLFPWQLWITLAIFIFLGLTVKLYGVDVVARSRDLKFAAVGFLIAFPFLLWGCMLVGPYNYLADKRYYWPVVPLSLFVVYSVASITDARTRRSLLSVIKGFCILYVTSYIAMVLLYIIFFFTPTDRGREQIAKLLGSDGVWHWPSTAVVFEFSPAHRLVKALLKEDRDTLLLTSKAGWFYWDPAVNQSRLYELNCDITKATYVSGPARLVILTFDQGAPRDLWYIGARADCFERLPDLKLLQRFPEEGVKVLESRVSADKRVILRP